MSSNNAANTRAISSSRTPEQINEVLKAHSAAIKDWEYSETAAVLHQWAERFNSEFQLGLQVPAIRIDSIRRRALGTYQPGRNGLGVKHEITLNAKHLGRPLAEQLETLLHELIHEWQDLYGKAGRGNYHNRQFRNKAMLYGLIVSHRGYLLGIRPGRFTKLLEQHGVGIQSLRTPEERPVAVVHRGHSKMRKYRCGCTTVRCATEFIARCEVCGQRFEEAPPSW